ncbi:Uncharacterised protein [Mycobacteroides abscessus]|nr:Uncharacterised protein [Mycobacteroides abscessus]
MVALGTLGGLEAADEPLRMVVVIRAGLAGVEVRWRNPFGNPVTAAFSGGPALLEQPMVRAAGEGQIVDVGGPVVAPVVDVMNLAEVTGHGTSGC